MLSALRHAFPGAFIAWIVEPPVATLLEGHAALDELIVIPRTWYSSPSRVWSVRNELRRWRFDYTLDPQGLSKSSLLAWLSGAKNRIGFKVGQGRELSPWLNNCLVQRTTENVVDRYLELLQPLNIHNPKAVFDLPIHETARTWAANFVRQKQLAPTFYVVNAGASWSSRMWELDRFSAVARHLSRRWSLQGVVVWAGAEERRLAAEIVAGSDGGLCLAPETSLQQLGALLEMARMYVGTDTGPLHLAVSVGTKCVSLHGTTRGSKSGPYGEGHVCVQSYYQQGSSRVRRAADNSAMRAIGIEDVCHACDRVLDRHVPTRDTRSVQNPCPSESPRLRRRTVFTSPSWG
jgi:ADP-heptose:LPS heptosyltransferase